MDSQTSSLRDSDFSGVVCHISKALHIFTCLCSVTLKSFAQLLKKCSSGSWQIWQTCLLNSAFTLCSEASSGSDFSILFTRKSVEWVTCGSVGLLCDPRAQWVAALTALHQTEQLHPQWLNVGAGWIQFGRLVAQATEAGTSVLYGWNGIFQSTCLDVYTRRQTNKTKIATPTPIRERAWIKFWSKDQTIFKTRHVKP